MDLGLFVNLEGGLIREVAGALGAIVLSESISIDESEGKI